MNNKYRRLCEEDRKVIANLQQAGKTHIEIAQAIGFSQSAVSKEPYFHSVDNEDPYAYQI